MLPATSNSLNVSSDLFVAVDLSVIAWNPAFATVDNAKFASFDAAINAYIFFVAFSELIPPAINCAFNCSAFTRTSSG